MKDDQDAASRLSCCSAVPLWLRWAAVCVVAGALLSGGAWVVWSALPGSEAVAKTPIDLPQGVGLEQKLDVLIPGRASFTDAEGRTVQLAELFDEKPVVLHLVYFRCPMLCNLSMDALVRTLNTMQLAVGRDFNVVTISFDPREGPELAAAAKRTALQRYRISGATSGWHFLTGDEPAIAAVTEAVGFRYKYDPSSGQYAHAAGLILLTPERRTSRYITGVDYAARDLRLALVEASAGQVGSVTDQVLLLCYRYDPLTGKYGLAISRAIQILGLVTVLTLVGGIGYMLRQEARS